MIICLVLVSRIRSRFEFCPYSKSSPAAPSEIVVEVPDSYIPNEKCYILGLFALSLTSQALATNLAGKKVFLTRYIRSQNPPAELLEESQYKMVGWDEIWE